MNTDKMKVSEVLNYLRQHLRGRTARAYVSTPLEEGDCPITIMTVVNTRELYDEIRHCGISEDKEIYAYIDEDGDISVGLWS